MSKSSINSLPDQNLGFAAETHLADFGTQNKVQEDVRHATLRHGQSLNTWSTLTKVSESLVGPMDQSCTEYESLGGGARTLASAPNM